MGNKVIAKKRKAEVGEWVLVTNSDGHNDNEYKNGDIVQIVDFYILKDSSFSYYKKEICKCLHRSEYIVLENYQPEEVKVEEVEKNITFDWEVFKAGKVVVNCDTTQKVNEFLKECEKHEITWISGGKATDKNFGATCYCCFERDGRLGYSPKKFYEKEGANIIDYPFTPLITKVSRPAKVGEWVEIVKVGDHEPKLRIGDIHMVTKVDSEDYIFTDKKNYFAPRESIEYIVLENYQPEHFPINLGLMPADGTLYATVEVAEIDYEKVDYGKLDGSKLFAEVERRLRVNGVYTG